jgi:hypothetical protein
LVSIVCAYFKLRNSKKATEKETQVHNQQTEVSSSQVEHTAQQDMDEAERIIKNKKRGKL